MPADTNPAGDIFGGWLMSQMDLAAGNLAALTARGRAATIAVEGMIFHRPVKGGDEVSPRRVRADRPDLDAVRAVLHPAVEPLEDALALLRRHPRPVDLDHHLRAVRSNGRRMTPVRRRATLPALPPLASRRTNIARALTTRKRC